ncbi:MAG: DNA internalization-related competence protein ComEC/Rec2 [Legionella sp.]|jgi:competence protein ComEC
MEIFCFVLGVLYGFTLNYYLPCICLLFFFIKPHYHIILGFTLGVLLAFMHQYCVTPKNMPNREVLAQVTISGTIVSIPSQTVDKTQWNFELDTIDNHPVSALIQLAWYSNKRMLHVGERWQFKAKLKKPRNFSNPGSFDYAGALAARHIYWTGYVRSDAHLLAPASSTFNWLNYREHLGARLNKLATNKQVTGILEALTLNLTNHINQEQWDLFRRTGTTHLFGISGEHIALISGLIFYIVHWLWSRSTFLCLRIPALYSASIAGLISALIYAFLAGFGPPVQRALIGSIFYCFCYWRKQQFSSWQIWRYALVGVLCIEPHAVFMQGFYFSFLAVACILLTQQRWQFKGIKSTLALQLSCLIGLMPLTLYWYAYGSLNGFLANLFAIPLVGLVIVPLALITLVVAHYDWAYLLMKPLSYLVLIMLQGLQWVEHLAFINIDWSLNSIELVCALMGALLLWIMLPIKPFRAFAFLWISLPFIPLKPSIKPGEALMQILDVGQGLAIVIQTQHHIALYDTGDQYFNGSDLGTLVILPYLKTLGIRHIDSIVISHPDKDHRGGLESIISALPINNLLVNDPSFYKRGRNCHKYPAWNWDGVDFRFLPINISVKDRNNSCCILQVSTSVARVLLTGDIEKKAENYLILNYDSNLKSQAVILPHHGSKTSSSYRFIQEIAPLYAIASLGFDNKFGFPHAKTLSTMTALGVDFYRTDECGMVTLSLPSEGTMKKPVCYKNNAS